MQPMCKTCTYFYQHYTFAEKKIVRVFCGHCVFQKPKNKRPSSKACQHYVQAESREQAFVSKEYLSKALLDYLLNLELLPEICDSRESIR